ncbi:atp-dependent clp protease proteolytic subunit [Nannochloropsis gaditana]|uniref:ATP-dependent Clp protease proteolytic subunit n=1 Tax=Nannochloropsis gaditana TaxID=72520 RepID=W7TXT5_9STRA|nr:atp-dependent clp protease proteolytic subunit [Nannochloropsis gaditana]
MRPSIFFTLGVAVCCCFLSTVTRAYRAPSFAAEPSRASKWMLGSRSAGIALAPTIKPAASSSRGGRGGAGSLVMMPIGVPKVAYRVPGSGSADWVDIYNRLYRERIIFLGQEIDDDYANQIIGVLLYLDQEDSSRPIYMYINCPGGSVIAGLAIYDVMQLIRSEIVTINIGMAASMASFLLAAGKKGKRLALPHSRVMIHQPMGGAQGQAEDIKVEAAQILRIKKNLVGMYSKMTGRATEQIVMDLDRDNYLSAQEALEHGLIDEIVELEKAMEPESPNAQLDPVRAFAGVGKDDDPLKYLP